MISLLIILAIMGLIIYLNKKNYSLGLNLAIGAVLLAIFTLQPLKIPRIVALTVTSVDTIELLAAVSLVQIMGYILEQTGRMEKLINSLYALFADLRMLLIMIPSLIGFIPGPGVVMLSAPLIEESSKATISADLKSYINYWFRATVQFCYPISFSFLITINFVDVNPMHLFLLQLPVTIVMFIIGYYAEVKKLPKEPAAHLVENTDKTGDFCGNILCLLSTGDFMIILLFVALVINIRFSFAVSISLLFFVIREGVPFPRFISLFIAGFSSKIFFLILGMLIFKTAIEETSIILNISEWWMTTGLPLEVLFFVLPVLIGLVTGAYAGAAAVSFSLLAPVLISNNLGVVYVALIYSLSKVGVMISPINTSLLLSIEYFNANLTAVYKKFYQSLPGLIAVIAAVYIIGTIGGR